jgi:hypothetical protein
MCSFAHVGNLLPIGKYTVENFISEVTYHFIKQTCLSLLQALTGTKIKTAADVKFLHMAGKLVIQNDVHRNCKPVQRRLGASIGIGYTRSTDRIIGDASADIPVGVIVGGAGKSCLAGDLLFQPISKCGLNCGFTYGALFSIKFTRTVLILSGIVPTSLKL